MKSLSASDEQPLDPDWIALLNSVYSVLDQYITPSR